MRLDQGGFRLFGLFGIDVFVHWSWALVAAVEIGTRKNAYSTQAWNVAEYLALFLIVLMHEFGHALACRSVGGKAERIILWPLGGVAFVSPPPRPGAVLWSIAAGPLVNLVLLPVTAGLALFLPFGTDASQFAVTLAKINFGLLVFNLLPFYPLDGGQILRSILWFFLGPTRSLKAACVVGIAGAGAVALGAVSQGSMWLALLAGFGGMRAWRVLQAANIPRREGVACPSCAAPPPVGAFWTCPCGARFDAFETMSVCPSCGTVAAELPCLDCQKPAPLAAWLARPAGTSEWAARQVG